MIPDIGLTVMRIHQWGEQLDYVAQIRIGDEQSVLVWGAAGLKHERFQVGDKWKLHIFTSLSES